MTRGEDLDNARYFLSRHGDDVRFCPEFRKWLVWTGQRWELDETGAVNRLWDECADELWDLAGIPPCQRKRARSTPGSEAGLKTAQHQPGIPVRAEALDADPDILNCPNGIVNLRTGELTPHDRTKLCTRITGCDYDPLAFDPEFAAFIDGLFQGNTNLIGFMRRAVGYSLTGRVDDQCLFLQHGWGCNGKGTLMEVLRKALGSYCGVAAPGLMLDHDGDRHPTEVADLCGKRLVIASEAGEGKRIAEELVKRLTGGDTLKARRMREDFWEFEPRFKLWFQVNHRPAIRGTDDGIWRRIHLIPFDAKFVDAEDAKEGDLVKDKTLRDRLIASHLTAVLNWAVNGAASWYEEGLRPPPEVRAATAEYRDEQDHVGAFLTRHVRECPGQSASNPELRAIYEAWCEENGEKYPLGRKQLTQELQRRGYRQGGDGGKRWLGIRLAVNEEPGTEE